MESSAVNIRQVYFSLLRRCFTAEEKQFVESFLTTHNLSGFVEETLEQVEKIAALSDSIKPVDLDDIKTIAYHTLKAFNTAIATIKQETEKARIKELLSKFGNLLQMEISQRTSQNYPEVSKSVIDGLAQAVHTEKYNPEDFKQHFPSGDIDISKKEITVELGTNKKEFLIWDEHKADLNQCARLLSNDYFYFKSINEFKSLFNDPYGSTTLKCEDGKINNLILFFEKLWDEDIIILKGGNGFWLNLERRLVDYRKQPFDFPFRKRAYNLHAKSPTEPIILKELEQILASIKK